MKSARTLTTIAVTLGLSPQSAVAASACIRGRHTCRWVQSHAPSSTHQLCTQSCPMQETPLQEWQVDGVIYWFCSREQQASLACQQHSQGNSQLPSPHTGSFQIGSSTWHRAAHTAQHEFCATHFSDALLNGCWLREWLKKIWHGAIQELSLAMLGPVRTQKGCGIPGY